MVQAAPPAASAAGGPINGETYLWRHVAIGGGGFITGMDADPTGAVRVLRTDVHGAYVWSYNRNRWAQLVSSSSMPTSDRVQSGVNVGVFEVAIAPSNFNVIYMALKSGVYRSDNGGSNFVRTGMPSVAFDPNGEFRFYGPFMAVDPYRPYTLFFGTPQNGLWRSSDGGATWMPIGSVPYGKDLRSSSGVQAPGIMVWYEKTVGGLYSGRILASSPGNGVYVSTDGGYNFKPLVSSGATQPLTLKQGAYSKADGSYYAVDAENKTLWRFFNGTWRNLTYKSGMRQMVFSAIAVSPWTNEVYVFDDGGVAFRSSNTGENWTALSKSAQAGPADPPWLRVGNQYYFATASVRFDPFITNRMWIASGIGVFYADAPKGTSSLEWKSQTRGVEELVSGDVVQPNSGSPIFAAIDFGIHKKDDLNAFSTTYGPKERVLASAQQLDWSEGNPNFLVTNASDQRTTCCWQDGDAVLAGYSSDGGATWSKFANLPTPPGTSSTDPWRMSFGTIAVSAYNPYNIIWAPGYNRSPYYTKDMGKTWNRVVLPGEIGPNTGSYGSIWYNRKNMVADRAAAGVFYYVHSGDGANSALRGLWVTTNGGSSWTRVFAGEIAPASGYASKLRAVPSRYGQLFFTSGPVDGNDRRLKRSWDGGKSWAIVNYVDRVDDIAFGKTANGASYPTIFISGRVNGVYGVWRSIDDTRSWKKVADFPAGSLDQVKVIAADPDVFGRVYLGYVGSGWIYGEPATCSSATFVALADKECYYVK